MSATRTTTLQRLLREPLGFVKTPAVTGTTPVAAAAAAVRAAAVGKGLDEDALRSMLHHEHVADVDQVLAFCFEQDGPAPDRQQMRGLVGAVEALELGSFEDIDLTGPWRTALKRLRDLAAGALFLLCLYLVVGGVLSGQNTMANHTSPALTLTALMACLAALALLEAAHIAAVALSTADVSQLRESHPRVYNLHPFIATSHRLEQYLAGRQAGVVLVVFGVAEVTRTAGMSTLPGTSIAIPATTEVLLSIGVPGALMVLCIGQVAPQLLAARTPARLMNTALMAGAFTVTRWISNLGLATAASWFVAGFKGTERIATAPRQRYLSDSLDVDGFGIETLVHEVTVSAERSTTRSLTTTTFTRPGETDHSTVVATTTQTPRTTSSVTSLQRRSGLLPVVVTSETNQREHSTQGYLFTETHAPRVGAFEAGDTLHTSFEATYEGALLASDRILVLAPTRLVVLRVALEHPRAPLPPARLSITHETNASIGETSLVSPSMSEIDGSVHFTVIIRYPAVGSVITVDWDPEA